MRVHATGRFLYAGTHMHPGGQTRRAGRPSRWGGRLLRLDRSADWRGRGGAGQVRPRAVRRPGPARGVPAARPCARPSPPAAPPRFAMVERGDAAPLLRWAEGPSVSPPQAPELQAGGRGWGSGGGGRSVAEPPRRREPEELGAAEVLLQPGRLELGDVEEDQVVAVFVVTFDPRSGESRSGGGGWAEGRPPPGFGGGGGRGSLRAHPHPHTCTPTPPPGSLGANRVPPRGLGAGRGALFPAPSEPLSFPSRGLPAEPQSAPPSPQPCLHFSNAGGPRLRPRARWLLFSCLAERFFAHQDQKRPPGELLKRHVLSFQVLCFTALAPHHSPHGNFPSGQVHLL